METKKTCKICNRTLSIENFSKHPKTSDGYSSVCKECMHKLQSDGHKNRKENKMKELKSEVENARAMRLQDFTPRELIKRLKELGYEGTLTYTRVEKIDLSNI
jgi:hypothetical protein